MKILRIEKDWDFHEDVRIDRGFKYAPLDPDVPLQNLSPHYTNTNFRYPQTVYRRPNIVENDPKLCYDYDDRLYDWDYKKAEKTYKQAEKEIGNTNTARFFSAWLSKYHGKVIIVQHIMTGYNWGNGYPYRIFGYDKGVWNETQPE
jgi:hypothetical protein